MAVPLFCSYRLLDPPLGLLNFLGLPIYFFIFFANLHKTTSAAVAPQRHGQEHHEDGGGRGRHHCGGVQCQVRVKSVAESLSSIKVNMGPTQFKAVILCQVKLKLRFSPTAFHLLGSEQGFQPPDQEPHQLPALEQEPTSLSSRSPKTLTTLPTTASPPQSHCHLAKLPF